MLVLMENILIFFFRNIFLAFSGDISRRIFFDFLVEEMGENLYFAENRPNFLLPEYVNNVN